MSESWVHWARELLTMSQTGLTYSTDSFDIVRYNRIREIGLKMLSSGSGTKLASVARIFAAEKGHATPKLDVRAFVLKEGRVLLVRERREGLWSLPGGWADVGESPSEAIAREVLEESGYEVRISRLLAFYDHDRHDHPVSPIYSYKAFFLGELTGGAAQTSDETDAVGFFPLDSLPPLSTDRIVTAQLTRLFELANDPRSPADFD